MKVEKLSDRTQRFHVFTKVEKIVSIDLSQFA